MDNKLTKINISEIIDKAVNYLYNNHCNSFLESFIPILEIKCPFSKLDLLGKGLGSRLKDNPELLVSALDKLIEQDKMGSYVIASRGWQNYCPIILI
ncbi:MAG: hypothetical protein APG12_00596 [Candidatus Methanofastidiosum methylothiophilum]|uniref:Uncharacterized protein n=1 Tax=Candidatus Methanofastidiosum methylothiophilum TaxID=1705564 RepID=A0A150ITL7_9EURY|nr:MAG: hypothetical protein APG10_00545 [Candidatus Methanofastidiosum methylthiophilus]KYC47994.1 MAG: hypothetical protein APG11_00664 [Candidatus Methanofastidiosum methylthiophilus]KYC50684.1 MAG: hypothetical protein APG12_00596 [Candidatus Methanofastidiosum methylthiophilus]